MLLEAAGFVATGRGGYRLEGGRLDGHAALTADGAHFGLFELSVITRPGRIFGPHRIGVFTMPDEYWPPGEPEPSPEEWSRRIDTDQQIMLRALAAGEVLVEVDAAGALTFITPRAQGITRSTDLKPSPKIFPPHELKRMHQTGPTDARTL